MRMRTRVLGVILLWSGMAQAGAPEALQAALAGIQTMEADFKQQVYPDGVQTPQQQLQGHFAVQKPNRFRWQIKTPEQRVIVGDGQLIWNYDIDLAQVTKQSYAGLDKQTPIFFLMQDLPQLVQHYQVDELPASACGGGMQCFALVPRKSDGGFQRIQLGFQQKHLGLLELRDQFGQRSVITFHNVKLNVPVSAKQFSLSLPKGVDVLEAF